MSDTPRTDDDLARERNHFTATVRKAQRAILSLDLPPPDPDHPSSAAPGRDTTAERPQAPRPQRGSGRGLTKILADEILQSDHFAKDAGGQLFVFEAGAYRPHGDARIAQRVKSLLESDDDSARWSTHRSHEVTAYIAVDAPTLLERPDPNVLNVQNGLLDLTTFRLRPHTPDYLSPIQLPVAFDVTATCPRWESFIARILPQDCQAVPFEIVASAMRGEVSDQKAILLQGAGENGKSTFLNAVLAFLGRDNVSSLALQRLEVDKFSVVRLLGKLANICPDLPADHLTSTSTFKALMGGDGLTAERKFQGSFEFISFARLIFSTNHYPQSKDASHAFFRRWHVVPFDAVIDPRERIPNLSAQLAEAHELSGALNRALAVLPSMIQSGGFSQTATTRAALMEFREMTDPLAAWLDRFTVLGPEHVVSRRDLLIAHNAAAATAGRPPMSAKAFCGEVRRLRPTIEEAQRMVHGTLQWVFLGLGLADSPGPLSHHSHHFSQISLGVKEKRGEEEKNLNKGNGVNGAIATDWTRTTGDRCFGCHGTKFWVSVHGSTVCAQCHPPATPDVVEAWLEHEGAR